MGKNLLPLREAVERALGKSPSDVTLYRWIKEGRYGVVLRSQMFYGRRCSTVADVQRFAKDAKLGGLK